MAEEREFNFIKSRLDDLAPAKPGKRDTYRDTKVPGLIIRVTDKGAKSFAVYKRIKGEATPVKVTIGPYPALTIEQARTKAKELIGAMALGANPNTEAKSSRNDPTLSELVNKYLDLHSRPLKKTWKLDQARLDRNWLPRLGSRPAKEVTRQEVREVYESIKARGEIEANRNLQLIRAVYNWALGEYEDFEANPAARVKTVAEYGRDRVLNSEEIAKVWAATYYLTGPMGALYRLKLITAQRSGEVEAMRWSDIDGFWWNIPREFTKAKRPHRVFLTALALDELSKLPASGPWVFPSDSKSGHLDNVVKALERLRKVSGIKDFTGHDFRRTAASVMPELGIPRLVVGYVLNHSARGDDSAPVTGVYDRYSYDKEKQDALERWAARLTDVIARPVALQT